MQVVIAAAWALIKGALAGGWVRLLPWLGPLLLKARPWLGFVPGLGSVARWARVAAYAAVLGLGVWGGVSAHQWWWRDYVPPEVLVAERKAAVVRSRIDLERAALIAERDALVKMKMALDQRAEEIASFAIMQQQFEAELDGARHAGTQGDDVGVIAADDPWLRAWQRRGR